MLERASLILVLTTVFLSESFCQANLWKETEIDLARNQRTTFESKTFQVNESILKTVLLNAPKEETKKVSSSTRLLPLPTPEGIIEKFRIVEYQLMEEALAEKYPHIKTYYGISTIDPTKTLRLDITERGLRAEVKNSISNYVIKPLEDRISGYEVFYQTTNTDLLESVRCEIDHDGAATNTNVNRFSRSAGSCDFKTFRLAIATTAEYSNYFGATSSAQSGIVLSEVVTAMNRVNGIFEGELGIRMLLVGNTDQVFYYNSSTDPYTNNSGATMLNENTPVLNNIIGVNNYDIGHVFSTGGSGIATPASVCTGSKARGVSGRIAPITDSYYVDFVAHEMGHQLGAFHTQNNNCARSSQSFEPGSGSTIMSYAGICAPNVQSTPDDYFHTASLIQIGDFVTTGAGTCYNTLSYSNNPPTVDAGQDYSIPKSTPFELVAIASDPDNDPLLYRWEQWDNELAIMPPFAGSVVGPMFRSYPPTSEANRIFPNLDDILNNTNNTWEVLPTVARTMDFIVTVKDETGTASCTESDSMSINVVGSAGPFLVTSPNTSVTLVGGQSTTITWDVAGTNNSPINCNEVDILLSYDLGVTFTDTLVTNTNNDGSATVVLPSPATNGARIMVKASNNIFFDVSDIFFTILPDPSDSDGDGVANGIDCAPNDPNIAIVDSCGICGGDGTTCIDVDNDGFIADIDPDDNDPCVPDNTVGACDSDNDGVSDGLDCAPFDNSASAIDACGVCGGDGTTCVDADGDGVFADVDPDDNDPCIPDNTIGACDSDNDGVSDGLDCAPFDNTASVVDACGVCGGDGTSCVDADGDGVFADVDPNDNDPCTPDNTNSLCDTDSDGVADGLDCAPFDPGIFMVDSCGVCGGDGTSCVDADGDGYFADEDPDDNDPCNPDSFTNACDSDNDGTPDGLDCAPLDPNNAILDSCSVCGGDGSSCADMDMDGYIADIDPDDNDPCVPDNTVGNCDNDGDGVNASNDPDDNNPCIPNNASSACDNDNDGVFADVDPDDNDPCNPDNTTTACDSDGDGVPNGADCAPNDPANSIVDSCGVCGGDGTTCIDADGDGIIADVDPDDNDPCNPDNTVGLCDSDNDGTPDGLDCAPNDASAQVIDSCGVCGGTGLSCSDLDGDGVFADVDPDDNDPCNPDNTVGACDSDNDGTPDGLDCAPNDPSAQVVDSCGVCGGAGLSCSDLDGDGVFADVDPDDNDPCVPDNTIGLCDSDNDGTPDGLDCAPNDASAQVLDNCGVCGGDGTSCVDLDGDGFFADVDPDDNDPCNPDNTVGVCDSDNDGTPDGLDCAPNDASAQVLDACNVCGGDGTTCTDLDGDGFFAEVDPDDNDPCNPDNTVGVCDSDNDGTPDGLDCAPNDASAQVIDSCGVCGGAGLSCSDLDGDGVFADVDPDDNDPCVPDNTIGLCDSDNDGTPDGLDCAPNDATAQVVDSCGICGGAGLTCSDLDGDGVFADEDPDDNDPCVPDNTNSLCDSDNDGTPDGLDCAPNDPTKASLDACGVCGGDGLTCTDADGDGVFADVDPDDNDPCNPDNTVGACDSDNDGTPDGLDCAPNDGSAQVIDACGVCGGDGSTCVDNDNDGTASDTDPDDNDPCVPDNTVGACDTDGDGTPDGLDPCPDDPAPDTDGDGVCGLDDICPGGDDNVDNNGNGIPDACENCPVINFINTPLVSYSGQDAGTVSTTADGLTILLEGNSWKALRIDYTITSNTIIEFEFGSTEEGEIHEVLFDDNLTLSAIPRFRLFGSQPVSGLITDFTYTNIGVWTNFKIPVGDYYTGFREYVVFTMDNDANPGTGNSYFRNVKIYEDADGDGECDLICVEPSCTDNDNDGVFADVDPDDNNPCVPDNTIGLCDSDNDGTPDGLDCAPLDATAQVIDSCGVCGGVGLTCSDLDGDGVFADVDPDDNDACVPDNTNGLCDTDNDGTPDGLDCAPLDATAAVIDSCGVCGGAGLTCSDLDDDGVFADVDPDDNDACVPDNTIGLCDSDNDGTPDGLDCAPLDPTKAIIDACNVCGGDGSTCTDNDNDGFAADIDPDDNDPCNPDNTVGACDSDNDGTPDGLDCAPNDATAQVIDSCGICGGAGLTCSDLDGDGVFADVDPDDNDACVPDNTIGLCDSDNDGTPDGLDCAPNDATAQVIDSCGVCGGAGLTCSDLDGDGVFADVDPDDNDACVPDNTIGLCDTDNDGTPDGLDCAPLDATAQVIDSCGLCGGAGLTCSDLDGDGVFADVDPDDNNPCVPDDTVGACDSDGDGVADGLDCAPLDPTKAIIDACNVCGGDGSTCTDNDNDGFAADIDPDDNDPCNPDNTVGACDSDNDGTPDGLDCAPNDATAQVIDSCGICGGAGLTCSDLDGDGVFADVDPDDNDACVPDNTIGLCDSDNDGTPDGLDCAPLDATAQVIDSCGVCGGEGLTCSDLDGDGVFADVDPDDNDACVPDNTIGLCDSDNDGTPDGLDCAPNDATAQVIDSCGVCGGEGLTCSDLDGDGVFADVDPDDNDPCNPDNTAGACDSDNDGTPDGLDCAPNDATAQVIDSCGVCGGEGLTCSDLDGDGVFADVDPDDNDACVPDNTIGLCDSDNDGTPDGLDCAPNDATAQMIDSCGVCGGAGLTCSDLDGDGVFADVDPDDNDPCVPDNTFGGCDTDGDGVPDGLDQCPGVDDALIGQSCDDGDPLTINDVYTSNCICEGISEVNIMFALIDADADTIIRIIEDGDTIVLDVDGFNLNIQALPSVSVESIQFGFDGNTNFRIENFPPYALHSDSNGNFVSWTPNVGTYNLIALAFDANGANGNLVVSNEIDFVVLRDQDVDGVLSDLDPDDQNPCVPDNTFGGCDTDGDGIPDGLDPCPTDPSPDSDGDGVCDSEDQCPGSDDTIDNNGDGIPDGCENCPTFDFNATPLISYTQQDNGTVDYDANGLSFFLENNSWKALQIDYTVTENTIVQFEFKSTEEGELHEIGFDNNLSLGANPRFKLYGFQPTNNVNTDFNYTDTGNWQSFSIPLGDYYSGFRRYILFAADNDANPSVGNSSFRNIKIFEDEDGDGACDLNCVTLDCVDEDGDGVFADVDPDDNDACVPNATSGDCCSLIVMNDQSLGTGSFLKAIECATDGDTIVFHPDVYGAIINLNDQFVLIDKHLYIKADITNNITINGTSLGQTFEILNGFDVVIEGLNIVSGTNAIGRAINNDGNLILKDCNIYDALGTNTGNAILNKGSLLIKGEVNLINN